MGNKIHFSSASRLKPGNAIKSFVLFCGKRTHFCVPVTRCRDVYHLRRPISQKYFNCTKYTVKRQATTGVFFCLLNFLSAIFHTGIRSNRNTRRPCYGHQVGHLQRVGISSILRPRPPVPPVSRSITVHVKIIFYNPLAKSTAVGFIFLNFLQPPPPERIYSVVPEFSIICTRMFLVYYVTRVP